MEAAIERLGTMYPEVPVGYPEGARNTYSSYLHLIVCYLELEGIARLLSPPRLQAVWEMLAGDHYTWVYQTLMTDWARIGAVVDEYDLTIPPRDAN